MFVIKLTYKKPIHEVDRYLAEHRAFLARGYERDFFIASGPTNPRTGGIILSQLTNREQLISILQNDPFIVHDIADYELIEFEPVKYHPNFISFI